MFGLGHATAGGRAQGALAPTMGAPLTTLLNLPRTHPLHTGPLGACDTSTVSKSRRPPAKRVFEEGVVSVAPGKKFFLPNVVLLTFA